MSGMRTALRMLLLVSLVGCEAEVATSPGQPTDDGCQMCTNPDLPECDGCLGDDLGSDGPPDTLAPTAVDQLHVSESELSFAIIGDTRPATINDTAGYPSSIIKTIFQDLEATSPRPGFAVGTGDYQFSSTSGTTTSPQLDKYLAARAAFSNPEYPAMGNHECTGATRSNCGTGTTNGVTAIYTAFKAKMLTPLGLHNPYYSVLVKPPSGAWSAKVVFVAANYWTSAQATWLDNVLSQPTTYTFIVRHESSKATTAPGVMPSGAIIASHPYTMLIVGHDHTYKRLGQREVLVGNGGAPLTAGSAYGYGIVRRRSDGAVQLTFYNYKTHAVLDTFAVKADGSKATATLVPDGDPVTADATDAAPTQLAVPHVGTPIDPDGELDEDAWLTPARTGPFTDAAGNIASPYSEARFLRDDDQLYLGLYAADEDVRTTDAFVVDLSSPRGHVTMRFSADGHAEPAKLHARAAIDLDGSINAPADDDEEWLVEGAIPLASIPFAADGTVNAVVTRCDVTKDNVRRCGSWRGTLRR